MLVISCNLRVPHWVFTVSWTRERIISVEDLATATATAVNNAQQEPLVVTENGRPAVYLVSIEFFDALMDQLHTLEKSEFEAAVALGEEQFNEGAFKTLAESTVKLPAHRYSYYRHSEKDFDSDWFNLAD
ncbi:MAG: type II toxin-antitoxin system Phd/YefM family antitoxin [Chloroflexi bacterium]|nr:type II toxin-antitoxin system Phd/YefM family antitoxin [Chloroflexota bacterium]